MKRLLLVLVCMLAFTCAFCRTTLSSLRTNGLLEASGIDCCRPITFGWNLLSDANNTEQVAYRIKLMCGSQTIWDTGKVNSEECFGIRCDKKLDEDMHYKWMLEVWDNTGRSVKSCSSFSTGISKWRANWIGYTDKNLSENQAPEPVYFRGFATVSKKISQASLYISSHGLYDAYICGKAVTDSYLNPGWTTYEKRIQYRSFDVTSLLEKGQNEIVVLVTPGWWASGLASGGAKLPKRYGQDMSLIAELHILYSDGTSEISGTGEGWEMSLDGPVTWATLYDGETVDKTKEFKWEKAGQANCADALLVSSIAEPVRTLKILKPVRTYTSPKGEKIIDFGQNIAGWERVNIHTKGTVVIRHAEDVDSEGNMNFSNLRAAKATSTFTGGGQFEPKHTFYGFRYISVDGEKGELDMDDYEAVAISSSFESASVFESSNPLINQLHSNIWWSWRDNFVDIPTDCPQRSERLGWTGDAEVFYRTATFLGNIDMFTRKWLISLSDEQLPDGAVTQVVPNTFSGPAYHRHAAGWADAATIIPWQHYMAFGDKSSLEAQYPSMKAWVDYMVERTDNNLYTKALQPYGDWLSWHPENDRGGNAAVTSKELAAQSFYIYSLDILAHTAKILCYKEDESRYEELAKLAREAYMYEFVTPSGLISSDTQTAYVLALSFDILPESMRQCAIDRLVKNIERYNYHITTGFLGTSRICQVLSEAGRTDIAFKLLLQEDCPGWLYQINMGATTIWEHWNAMRPDRTIINGGNVSLNHYSYGAIGDWLYRYVAGIRELSPGYKTFKIAPCVGGGISSLCATTKCPFGIIEVKWTAENDKLTNLAVSVPVGTKAEIHCPDGSVKTVGSGNWHF